SVEGTRSPLPNTFQRLREVENSPAVVGLVGLRVRASLESHECGQTAVERSHGLALRKPFNGFFRRHTIMYVAALDIKRRLRGNERTGGQVGRAAASHLPRKLELLVHRSEEHTSELQSR